MIAVKRTGLVVGIEAVDSNQDAQAAALHGYLQVKVLKALKRLLRLETQAENGKKLWIRR
jgi:hypothetical protein